MLKMMVGDAENGYYTAAVTCASICTFIYYAIIESLQPVILKAKKDKSAEYEKNIIRLYSIILFLTLLQGMGFMLLAGLIVRILYGLGYMEAAPVLQILSWQVSFSFMGIVRNIWILAEGKQHLVWKINLVGALINVFVNALLIPHWGACGAAFASLMTQVLMNFVLGFITKDLRENNRLLLKGLNPKRIFDND